MLVINKILYAIILAAMSIPPHKAAVTQLKCIACFKPEQRVKPNAVFLRKLHSLHFTARAGSKWNQQWVHNEKWSLLCVGTQARSDRFLFGWLSKVEQNELFVSRINCMTQKQSSPAGWLRSSYRLCAAATRPLFLRLLPGRLAERWR